MFKFKINLKWKIGTYRENEDKQKSKRRLRENVEIDLSFYRIQDILQEVAKVIFESGWRTMRKRWIKNDEEKIGESAWCRKDRKLRSESNYDQRLLILRSEYADLNSRGSIWMTLRVILK